MPQKVPKYALPPLLSFTTGRTSSAPTKNQCRRQAGMLLILLLYWICEDLCGIKRSSEICSLKFELGSAAGLREKIAYGKCSFPGNIGIERENRIWAGLSKKIAYGCLVGEFGSIPPASSRSKRSIMGKQMSARDRQIIVKFS